MLVDLFIEVINGIKYTYEELYGWSDDGRKVVYDRRLLSEEVV